MSTVSKYLSKEPIGRFCLEFPLTLRTRNLHHSRLKGIYLYFSSISSNWSIISRLPNSLSVITLPITITKPYSGDDEDFWGQGA